MALVHIRGSGHVYNSYQSETKTCSIAHHKYRGTWAQSGIILTVKVNRMWLAVQSTVLSFALSSASLVIGRWTAAVHLKRSKVRRSLATGKLRWSCGSSLCYWQWLHSFQRGWNSNLVRHKEPDGLSVRLSGWASHPIFTSSSSQHKTSLTWHRRTRQVGPVCHESGSLWQKTTSPTTNMKGTDGSEFSGRESMALIMTVIYENLTFAGGEASTLELNSWKRTIQPTFIQIINPSYLVSSFRKNSLPNPTIVSQRLFMMRF